MIRQESAATAYESLRESIDLLLGEIEAGLDEHLPLDLEQVHWGHVGDLESFAECLREVADRLCHHGEFQRGQS